MAETFIIIKPDAIEAGQVGQIIARFEAKGYRITGILLRTPSRSLIEEHYKEHEKKEMFKGLCDQFTDKEVFTITLTHPLYDDRSKLIQVVRTLIGSVNTPGSIRGDFGKSFQHNSIHASDSEEALVRELKLWFS
jgi:nucleoside-diphosphate kinase